MSTNFLAGKKYTWMGDDFLWASTTQTRYITEGTGDTIKDNVTSAPADASAADWIVSDDLSEFGAKTASLRIKVTKTATASAYTAGTHYCNGLGAIDRGELAATKVISSGTSPMIYMACSGNIGNGSIQIPTYLTSGATVNAVTYGHVQFFSSPVGGLIVPIRFIAVTLVMVAHRTNDPANHKWQFAPGRAP